MVDYDDYDVDGVEASGQCVTVDRSCKALTATGGRNLLGWVRKSEYVQCEIEIKKVERGIQRKKEKKRSGEQLSCRK